MDKASIVGDASLYLQDLQTQAKKLRSEIAGLESPLEGREKNQQGIVSSQKKTPFTSTNYPICKNIFQVDMFQVGERGFYGRVECNRGQGVAPLLYKALESLTRLNLSSSNLGTLAERFILTFNLKMLDRYEQHTLKCSSCRNAYTTFQTLEKLLIGSAVVAATAGIPANMQLRIILGGVAIVSAALAYTFHELEKNFVFVDYVHTEIE